MVAVYRVDRRLGVDPTYSYNYTLKRLIRHAQSALETAPPTKNATAAHAPPNATVSTPERRYDLSVNRALREPRMESAIAVITHAMRKSWLSERPVKTIGTAAKPTTGTIPKMANEANIVIASLIELAWSSWGKGGGGRGEGLEGWGSRDQAYGSRLFKGWATVGGCYNVS